jgi:hypothetical protein
MTMVDNTDHSHGCQEISCHCQPLHTSWQDAGGAGCGAGRAAGVAVAGRLMAAVLAGRAPPWAAQHGENPRPPQLPACVPGRCRLRHGTAGLLDGGQSAVFLQSVNCNPNGALRWPPALTCPLIPLSIDLQVDCCAAGLMSTQRREASPTRPSSPHMPISAARHAAGDPSAAANTCRRGPIGSHTALWHGHLPAPPAAAARRVRNQS